MGRRSRQGNRGLVKGAGRQRSERKAGRKSKNKKGNCKKKKK